MNEVIIHLTQNSILQTFLAQLHSFKQINKIKLIKNQIFFNKMLSSFQLSVPNLQIIHLRKYGSSLASLFIGSCASVELLLLLGNLRQTSIQISLISLKLENS